MRKRIWPHFLRPELQYEKAHKKDGEGGILVMMSHRLVGWGPLLDDACATLQPRLRHELKLAFILMGFLGGMKGYGGQIQKARRR